MTQDEWLTSSSPRPMLYSARSETNSSKVRLFAAVCCARVAHLYSPERLRVVRALLQFANATIPLDAPKVPWKSHCEAAEGWAKNALDAACRPNTWVSTPWVSAFVARAVGVYAHNCHENDRWPVGNLNETAPEVELQERVQHCHLIRCIFGNPFVESQLDPEWLAPHDRAVERMAQTLHAENRYEDLPILADALEDAGCTDGAILEHCRSPHPHTQGCWVLARLLGK